MPGCSYIQAVKSIAYQNKRWEVRRPLTGYGAP